jgi:hypothetical protein
MEFTFEIITYNKTIKVITTGDLETTEVAKMDLKIRLIAKELKYKILYDCRLSKNKISITEAYYWFSTYYDKKYPELKSLRTAYLVNKEDWEYYSFFETTSYNRGIPIEAFLDENDVLKWVENR